MPTQQDTARKLIVVGNLEIMTADEIVDASRSKPAHDLLRRRRRLKRI
jgi:hypothetical protein